MSACRTQRDTPVVPLGRALRTVRMATPVHPLCQYWWPANPVELQYYRVLFASRDAERTGRLPGAVGASLLSLSGAPKEVLRQVRPRAVVHVCHLRLV